MYQPKFVNKNLAVIKKYQDDFTKFATTLNYLHFIAVPTFCYQLNYPKLTRIRKTKLFKRSVEYFIWWAIAIFVLVAFIGPIMLESVALKNDPETPYYVWVSYVY